MTVTEYEVSLGERIADLHRRLVAREYRAQPARRVWIPKVDGGQRPLAILVLEDKIVQRAVAMLLEAIYEPHFLRVLVWVSQGGTARTRHSPI